MKTLLFLAFFCANLFAGDTIVTTSRPAYAGGGSVSVVRDSGGHVTARATTVAKPAYTGGGSTTTVKSPTGKTTAVIVTTPKPAYIGGGSQSKVVVKK